MEVSSVFREFWSADSTPAVENVPLGEGGELLFILPTCDLVCVCV